MGRGRGGSGRSGRGRSGASTTSREDAQQQFSAIGDRIFFNTQPSSLGDLSVGDYFMDNYQLRRVTSVNQNTIRAINIRPNGSEGDTTLFQQTQRVRAVSRPDANEIIRLSRIING